jgi:micrococcal nuclease
VRDGTRALLAATLVVACQAPPAAHGIDRHVVVERVVDGDTLVVRDGERAVRVRLIGIDTPELHPSAKLDAQVRRGWDARVIRRLGRRATERTRRLVEGRTVRLELDVETHDRYGRLLAYVHVGDASVAETLLREGWATTLTIPPNVRYVERFRRLEAEARAARRGLWASWPPVSSR